MHTGRQAQSARKPRSDALLQAAVDVAVDAKNSLTGSAKVGNRLPLALWVPTRVLMRPLPFPCGLCRPASGCNIPMSIFSLLR